MNEVQFEQNSINTVPFSINVNVTKVDGKFQYAIESAATQDELLSLLGEYNQPDVVEWFDQLKGGYGYEMEMWFERELETVWEEIHYEFNKAVIDEEWITELLVRSMELDMLTLLYNLPSIDSIDFANSDVTKHFSITFDEAMDGVDEHNQGIIDDNNNWFGDTEENTEMILAEITRQRDLQKSNQSSTVERSV
jgi:hypothetical protein